VDLGTENYGLTDMCLPFQGRYRYYRKSTRGHNTLAFRDGGGFDPADAEASDQTVNTFSALTPGRACKWVKKGGGQSGGTATATATAIATATAPTVTCGAGEVMVVNLTEAYAPQLPNGLPNPAIPAAARPVVLRAFHLNANMSRLTVLDSISNSRDNVTWGIHTRADCIALHGSLAILEVGMGTGEIGTGGQPGMQLRMQLESTPPNVCGNWQTSLVQLPNGTLHNETRIPLYGAKKLWSVCTSAVSELRVTLSDF
jgi:hypothetical protein